MFAITFNAKRAAGVGSEIRNMKKKEIGEFRVGRPDFGGRWPRGEALGRSEGEAWIGAIQRMGAFAWATDTWHTSALEASNLEDTTVKHSNARVAKIESRL